MKYINYILFCAALSGCASWGDNIGAGLETHADSIAIKLGRSLIVSMRDSLTSKNSSEKFGALIDSVLHHAGVSSGKQLSALLDTLSGETTNGHIKHLLLGVSHDLDSLRDDVLGKKMSIALSKVIQEGLLGPKTQAGLANLVSNGALGPATQVRFGNMLAMLRDTLTGAKTQGNIDSIVARSLARLNQEANAQQTFLTKNISTILWTGGSILGLILILAAYLFVRKRKAEKMLGLISRQIYNPNKMLDYDTLTKGITAQSAQAGVGKDYRVFLAKHVPTAEGGAVRK